MHSRFHHDMTRPTPADFGLRMLRAAALLALALACASPLAASDSTAAGEDNEELPGASSFGHESAVLPAVGIPFRPGESLKFSVQYGFIKAGYAWLQVGHSRD